MNQIMTKIKFKTISMKFLSFLFLLTISCGFYAQDGISPLTANPDLYGKAKLTLKKAANTFDSTVVYITDTISIPFFDDFSRNKFQKYNTEITAPGLTEELFFSMLDVDTEAPLDAALRLTDTKTFRLVFDPVEDTTIYHYYDSTVFLYDNLSNYAPEYEESFGFPPFIVYDTLDGSNPADTVWLNDQIDYFQDSARIFIKQLNDPSKLWLNEQAYHNYRFSVDPWSLGVVTFDGLDENGYPYNFDALTNDYNDTLLAKPLDLSGHSPADSVYFSFLYQKEGFGDMPEEEKDSLFLEFYSPTTEMWQRIWRTEGGPTTDFNVAHIPLTNSQYFNKGFQFRFINYGSPAGSLDHFHIDFVNLRPSSGYQDTLFKDFAMVYPIASLLKDYTSVPWKHYRNLQNQQEVMSDSAIVTVRNGSELTENNQNGRMDIYHEGNLEGTFTLNASDLSGGDINYAPRTTYASAHDFSNGYFYDPNLVNDTAAYFDFQGIATAQFPNNPINDTTFGTQVFENYYAYDDGTAELAYGVTGIQGLLAIKFDAYQPDSLIGVKVHFVPSVVDVSNNLFLLTVWGDNNGKPGEVLYEDEGFFPKQPVYEYGRNEFHTYIFKDTMKVGVGETFYVGMRQIDEERLNIGFDANHDNSDKIFWSVDAGGNWYNASYPGSAMIRPIVSSKMNYTLGVEDYEIPETDYSFTIYPNPARNYLNFKIENHNQETTFEISDLNGRVVKHITEPNAVDISNLRSGFYIVTRFENKQAIKVQKLVVQ